MAAWWGLETWPQHLFTFRVLFLLFHRTWIRHSSHLWRWSWAVECLRWHCCYSSSSMCLCGGEIQNLALETYSTDQQFNRCKEKNCIVWAETQKRIVLRRESTWEVKYTTCCCSYFEVKDLKLNPVWSWLQVCYVRFSYSKSWVKNTIKVF